MNSCIFLRSKSIPKAFPLQTIASGRNMSPQSTIMLPPVRKSMFLLSSHIKIQPHICLELFLLVNSAWSVHISLLIQTRPIYFLNQLFGLILTAPIHCRGSTGEQVMYGRICLNLFWWRNKLIYILNGLRVSKVSILGELLFFFAD